MISQLSWRSVLQTATTALATILLSGGVAWAENYIQWENVSPGIEAGSGDGVINLAAGAGGCLYAITDHGALHRSNDLGTTWTTVTDQTPAVSAPGAVAINPSDSKVVLVAGAAAGSGLARSTDGGITWTTASGLASADVEALTISDDGALVLAGQRGGNKLSVSTDGGATWRSVDLGGDVTAQLPVIIDATHWVVGSDAGNVIRFSSDAGATWAAGSGSTEYFAGRLPLIRAGATLFSSKHHGINQSSDGGATWTYAMQTHTRVVGAAGEVAFREGDRTTLRGTKDRILNLELSDDLGSSWKSANCALLDVIPSTLLAHVIISADVDPYAHVRLATAWAATPDHRTVFLSLGKAGLYRGRLCWTKGGPILGQGALAPLAVPEGDSRTPVSVNVVASGKKAALKRVVADLAQVGGGELVLLDDGLHGDGAAGDKTFGGSFTVRKGTLPGDKVIGIIAEDEKGNLSSSTAVIGIAALAERFTVWDGDQFNKGQAWAQPQTPLIYLKAQTDEVHDGKVALEFRGEGGGWIGGGWNWHGWFPDGSGDDVRRFRNLSFWAKVEHQGDLGSLTVHVNSGNKGGTADVDVLAYCPDLLDGHWHEVIIPLSDMAINAKNWDAGHAWELGLGTWAPQQRTFSIYLDEIGFDNRPVRDHSTLVSLPEERAARTLGAEAVAVSAEVDLGAPGKPVSPWIYGVAMGDTRIASEMGATIRRAGGNPISPMDWRHGFSSSGADWYYVNGGTETPPERNWILNFHGESKKSGFESYVSIPLMGRAAKDGTSSGFDIDKYADQESWAGKVQPSDPHPKAGNGRQLVTDAAGKPLPGADGKPQYRDVEADPNDCSVAMTVEEQAGAHAFMMNKMGYGPAAKGGLKFIALDNEPCLWAGTHRAMHPVGTSYDELWDKTARACAIFKANDPDVKIAGPTLWGWTAYFCSGLDSQLVGRGKGTWDNPPDFAAHGQVPFALWYLQQVAAYKKKTGIQLVDYLDFHFYPQNGYYMGGTRNDPTVMEGRVQETRVMWDPTFVDPSWMGRGKLEQPHLVKEGVIQLIHLMRTWIAAAGLEGQMGISFGEYNFGGEEDISGGVAQSELFGVFAREGVDLAFYWLQPAMNSSTYFAWKMYRNPDGKHTQWGDRYLPSTVSMPNDVSLHASRDAASGRLSLIVINKRAAKGAHVTIKLSGKIPEQEVTPWEYGAADQYCIGLLPARKVGGDQLTIELPPLSVQRIDLTP